MAGMTWTASSVSPPPTRPTAPRAAAMTTVATVGFGIAFWAWALLGPLWPEQRPRPGLGLAPQALLLAVPLLLGSLGRIPVGVLTDRYGARVMFPAVSLATAVPVLVLAFVDSFPALLAAGFGLGVAGTSFAVGASLVTRVYPPAQQGSALGVFGIGTGGAALAGVTAAWGFDFDGRRTPVLVLAAVLVAYAGVAALVIRDIPTDRVRGSVLKEAADVWRRPVARRLAALYAVSFGGLVAVALSLPAYLRVAYGSDWTDAVWRTAALVGLAAVARFLGGWLSDRRDPVLVVAASHAVAAPLSLLLAFEPPLVPVATAALAGIALCLGCGSGALLALTGRAAHEGRTGAFVGAVGAAGGLGGAVPPLMLGAVYGLHGSYAIGLTLLAGLSAVVAVVVLSHGGTIGVAVRFPAAALASREGTVVVALSAADTGRSAGPATRALVELAAEDELVVVYGYDRAIGPSPHAVVAALRTRLPRADVVGVLVDPQAPLSRPELRLVNELTAEGAVVVAIVPVEALSRCATAVADQLGVGAILRVRYTALGGARLTAVERPR